MVKNNIDICFPNLNDIFLFVSQTAKSFTATGVTRVQPIKKKSMGYDNAENGQIQTFTDDNRHRLPKLSVLLRCRPYKSVVKRTQRVTMRKNNKFKIEEFQLLEELEAVLRKGNRWHLRLVMKMFIPRSRNSARGSRDGYGRSGTLRADRGPFPPTELQPAEKDHRPSRKTYI